MTTLDLAQRGRSLWTSLAERIDRVWLALGLGFAALSLLDPPQAPISLHATLHHLWEILPYTLFAILLAASVLAMAADRLVARAFQGRVPVMIVLASIVGATAPFCSCGVIPVVAALLAVGVPLAPVMAFWLASPLMDPTQFVLTAAALGPDFAIAKTAFAILIATTGGFVTYALVAAGRLDNPLRAAPQKKCCASKTLGLGAPVMWAFWEEPARREVFAHEAQRNALFLAKWLTVAYFLESLLAAYVPSQTIVSVVGGDGIGAILTAAAIAIPTYINGYAAIPLVEGLVKAGMAPGAAMTFMLGGGVTCVPAALAVFALVRRPVFAAYLGLSMAGSIAAGIIYSLIA